MFALVPSDNAALAHNAGHPFAIDAVPLGAQLHGHPWRPVGTVGLAVHVPDPLRPLIVGLLPPLPAAPSPSTGSSRTARHQEPCTAA